MRLLVVASWVYPESLRSFLDASLSFMEISCDSLNISWSFFDVCWSSLDISLCYLATSWTFMAICWIFRISDEALCMCSGVSCIYHGGSWVSHIKVQSNLTLKLLRLLSSNAQRSKEIMKITLTLSCWYSSESSRRVLSYEYPFAMVSVISQLFVIISCWAN